jgi:acetyltransferase-like isoleucine patch superfamily enzyme
MISKLYRTLATSQHWLPRTIRSIRRGIIQFSLPAPRPLILPFVLVFLAIRCTYYFLVRALVCEPFFKAQCFSYGKGLRTGVFLHWIQGKGRICTGDRVEFDGKCKFKFAARFSEHPTLKVGDGSRIGHGSSFTVGKSITIGRDCRIAIHVTIFDSPGHPSDPEARRAGQPVGENEVLPVVLGDNVWVGQNAIIFPGVTIGDNSIVAAGSSVMVSVPANVLVAGNPARQVRSLTPK